jgi:hypothetical protein
MLLPKANFPIVDDARTPEKERSLSTDNGLPSRKNNVE